MCRGCEFEIDPRKNLGCEKSGSRCLGIGACSALNTRVGCTFNNSFFRQRTPTLSFTHAQAHVKDLTAVGLKEAAIQLTQEIPEEFALDQQFPIHVFHVQRRTGHHREQGWTPDEVA